MATFPIFVVLASVCIGSSLSLKCIYCGSNTKDGCPPDESKTCDGNVCLMVDAKLQTYQVYLRGCYDGPKDKACQSYLDAGAKVKKCVACDDKDKCNNEDF